MKRINILSTVLFLGLLFSCEDLTELNENPNGVDPNRVNPNLVLSTVLTETAKSYTNLGYGDIAGVMQHTQKDGWWSGHNNYDWSDQDWAGYYAILEDNKLVYDKAVELGYEFHQGVALVAKCLMFGLITDLWGDAPYSKALLGEELGANLRPAFDSQEMIYDGILADLQTANTLLSKSKSEYEGIVDAADVIYGGDPESWRKLANSLSLRYYMRISTKKPEVAKAGILKIIGDPSTYPIISDPSEDATMAYAGTSESTSWPNSTLFDASQSNYSRIKMAATLVDKLQNLGDPRLAVWADKVEIPLVVDAGLPPGTDEIKEVDGQKKRFLAPDVVAGTTIDTDPEYVGLPVGLLGLPFIWNLNPNTNQGAFNPHVSQLNEIYKQASGPLLKSRLMSNAEVEFILAEAAFKGWIGDQQAHYEAGVAASLETWGVEDDYDAYITAPGVAFDGSLEQIMEQKWIASWTAATESWFDYRRTGLPDLQAGPAGKRGVLPVRFYYGQKELMLNADNAAEALDGLETTGYTQADGSNSAWSKPWVAQGTGEPW